MKYDKIYIQQCNGVWYLNGGKKKLFPTELLITDKINCPSKSFIDLYWAVGDVGFRDNEELTEKIKEK